MAITSYSTLKTAMAGWLDRSDLTSTLDDFIDLAEAQIARDLRVSAMVSALDETIASGVITVPAGFLGFTSVYIDGSTTQPLRVTSADSIYRDYPLRSSDSKPKYIAQEGTSFIFGPYPDSAYNVKGGYYAKLSPLGDGTGGTVTTNYLTDEAPDLLLFACLRESYRYLMDHEKAEYFNGLAGRALMEANERDKGARFSTRIPMSTVAR